MLTLGLGGKVHQATNHDEDLKATVDGEVVERRPDRVMTDGREWIVVDFKFGGEHPEYHDQVREYMQLLRQMGHSPVSGYLWFVYANRIVEVTNNSH